MTDEIEEYTNNFAEFILVHKLENLHQYLHGAHSASSDENSSATFSSSVSCCSRNNFMA